MVYEVLILSPLCFCKQGSLYHSLILIATRKEKMGLESERRNPSLLAVRLAVINDDGASVDLSRRA